MRQYKNFFKIILVFLLIVSVIVILREFGIRRPFRVIAGLYLIILSGMFVWPNSVKRFFPENPLPATWHRNGWILGVNYLSFLALSWIAFSLNDSYLLYSLDGNYLEIIAKQQDALFPYNFGFTNNFFQSLGNIWFPVNLGLDPGFFLAWNLESGEFSRVGSYLIFASELFISTFLLCSMLQRSAVVSSLAAWGLVLTVLPYHEFPAIYNIYSIAPNIIVSQTLLILVLFRQVGRGRNTVSVTCLMGIVFLLGHGALAYPAGVLLIAPTLLVFSVCLLVSAKNRREASIKIASVIAGLVALGLMGFPKYLIGIFQYTVPYFFSAELYNDRNTNLFVSIVYHNAKAEMVLFAFAFFGATLVTAYGKGVIRTFAVGLLVLMASIIGIGIWSLLLDSYRGPSILYFEFFLWPIYIIFAAIFLHALFNIGFRAIGYGVNKVYTFGMLKEEYVVRLPLQEGRYLLLRVIVLAGLPWVFFFLNNPGLNPVQDLPLSLRRPLKTPIVSTLEKEIALTPGGPFRGRVVTMTGQNLDKSIIWHDLNSLDQHHLAAKFGNTHRTIHLWKFNIPTLYEYSPLISPPFFLITRHFLERPGDQQMRSALVMRQFDPRILRALGVRFAIMDAPKGDGARLRIRYPDDETAELFLYELSDVNLGDYSPTQVIVKRDVKTTIQTLSNPEFDFSISVVLATAIREKLVPAKSSQIFIEPGRLRVSAKSEGTSLLVLPFEFSRCLKLESLEKTALPAHLIRSNLLQAGILFSGRLEANLTYFTGPFTNSGCRMEDADDMERLNIRSFRRVKAG